MHAQRLRESVERAQDQHREHDLLGVPVQIIDPLLDGVSIRQVIRLIEKYTLPRELQLSRYVDVIYVGDFDMLRDRGVNALYMDDAFYVSNLQSSEEDMVDDLVHEIAHVLEEEYYGTIYGDHSLEEEFMKKRFELLRRLVRDERPKAIIDKVSDKFDSPVFSMEVDNALLEIGYDLLWRVGSDLFMNPYAASSLREYLATGFEAFYLGGQERLNDTCPVLYNKLKQLNQELMDGSQD